VTERSIPYCRPAIGDDDIRAVVECLRNGWLTTGPRAKEFEDAFQRLSSVRHAVALNSCTAGLHLAMAALGVGPGDEVVMPSLTFAAGALSARHLGATPVFADIDRQTLCVTPETIKRATTNRTRVIMPMHYGGAPLEIDEITKNAHARDIRVIEDAAHALGTLDKHARWAGSVSDGAAYSFYATKNITTAEGGMFVTNDDDLAAKVRILSLHGMTKDAWKRYTVGSQHGYDIVALGYKYNMPDTAAALGICQLSKLRELQEHRDTLARYYLSALETVPGIRPVPSWPDAPSRHSWCVFAVLVSEEIGMARDSIISALATRGIGTSVHFMPTHQLSAFKDSESRLPNTDWAADRLISLPLYPGMSTDDAEYVVDALRVAVRAEDKEASRAAPL